jgi:hypothetical protein
VNPAFQFHKESRRKPAFCLYRKTKGSHTIYLNSDVSSSWLRRPSQKVSETPRRIVGFPIEAAGEKGWNSCGEAALFPQPPTSEFGFSGFHPPTLGYHRTIKR